MQYIFKQMPNEMWINIFILTNHNSITSLNEKRYYQSLYNPNPNSHLFIVLKHQCGTTSYNLHSLTGHVYADGKQIHFQWDTTRPYSLLFYHRGLHHAETDNYIFQWSALTRPQQTTLLNVTQWMLLCWLCENLCCTTLLRFVAAQDLAWLQPYRQLKTDAKSAFTNPLT